MTVGAGVPFGSLFWVMWCHKKEARRVHPQSAPQEKAGVASRLGASGTAPLAPASWLGASGVAASATSSCIGWRADLQHNWGEDF